MWSVLRPYFFTAVFLVLVLQQRGVIAQAPKQFVNDLSYKVDPLMKVIHEPAESGVLSPSALAVYVAANSPYSAKSSVRIYYSFEKVNQGFAAAAVVPMQPTPSSPYATFKSPYIHISRPFGSQRNRTITFLMVDTVAMTRSESYTMWFFIEATNRPNSFAFMVPGVETKGQFVKFYFEMKAAARASASGGQEFADFFSPGGIGTYVGQTYPLNLLAVDPALTGFEGGYAVNCSGYGSLTRQYGILVPFHTGSKFSGMVVKIDLMAMTNATYCQRNSRVDRKDANGVIQTTKGPLYSDLDSVCVHAFDLATLHPNARGFRRGFVKFPYVVLSPSEFSVAARVDACNFGLTTSRVVDLSKYDATMGGYSGGFADAAWSCFNPMKTFTGPFGGLRSQEFADNGHLTPFFHGRVVCVNDVVWRNRSSLNASTVTSVDFSDVESDLRGYSDALRVGRYAYFSPLSDVVHKYTSKVVRMYLGEHDVGTTMKTINNKASGLQLVDFIDVLDVGQANKEMSGFTGLFSNGKYLFLVPYRNSYNPQIGQRGHGFVPRIDMNSFLIQGVQYLDVGSTSRNQIPSTADEDLRGFACGFASGSYAVLVPFFNALFSGKLARFQGINDPMSLDLQELDLANDRYSPGVWKAFRGGFISIWGGE